MISEITLETRGSEKTHDLIRIGWAQWGQSWKEPRSQHKRSSSSPATRLILSVGDMCRIDQSWTRQLYSFYNSTDEGNLNDKQLQFSSNLEVHLLEGVQISSHTTQFYRSIRSNNIHATDKSHLRLKTYIDLYFHRRFIHPGHWTYCLKGKNLNGCTIG